MPNNADTSPSILFPLPEVPPPVAVENALPDRLFKEVQNQLKQVNWGPGSDSTYHSITSRWTTNISFSEEITNALLEVAKKSFQDPDLKHEFNYAARYQIHEGNIPYLWTHMDQNAGNHTIDLCVIKNQLDDWGLYVDGTLFSEEENKAICMSGSQQVHARPPYPTDNPEAYIVVLFSVFSKASHWWRELDGTQEKFDTSIEKYRWDGDIRYFEYAGNAPFFDNIPEQNKKCKAYGDSDCIECYVIPPDVLLEKIERNRSINKAKNNA